MTSVVVMSWVHFANLSLFVAGSLACLSVSEGDYRFSLPDFSSPAVRAFVQMIYAGANAADGDPGVLDECSRLEDLLGVEFSSQESSETDEERICTNDTAEILDTLHSKDELFEVEEVVVYEDTIKLPENKAENIGILSSSCPVCDKPVDGHGRHVVDEGCPPGRVFLCCLDSCSFKTVMKTAEKFLEHAWMHVRQEGESIALTFFSINFSVHFLVHYFFSPFFALIFSPFFSPFFVIAY